MKFYNFNTKSYNAWLSYQKNYIAPLSHSINSLFDYIMYFKPDYDILNSTKRNVNLKKNHSFMRNWGFYWGVNEIIKLSATDPSPAIFVQRESILEIDTKKLDRNQGWICYHNDRVWVGDNQPIKLIRDGDIFIKTTPEGQYGGYWLPQGNMGLYLPSYFDQQIIFTQQKFDENVESWNFNLDFDVYRYITTEQIKQTPSNINNIEKPMIWSRTDTEGQKLWNGQVLIPQIVSNQKEEVISDSYFLFSKAYINLQYQATLQVQLPSINLTKFSCFLQVC